MTAYALEILSEGIQTEWQDELFIDTSILNELADYILTVQDGATGSFYDNNDYLYDNKLNKVFMMTPVKNRVI